MAGPVFKKLRRKTALMTDQRVGLMDEVITNIKGIKLCAWENLVRGKVKGLRRCFGSSDHLDLFNYL